MQYLIIRPRRSTGMLGRAALLERHRPMHHSEPLLAAAVWGVCHFFNAIFTALHGGIRVAAAHVMGKLILPAVCRASLLLRFQGVLCHLKT